MTAQPFASHEPVVCRLCRATLQPIRETPAHAGTVRFGHPHRPGAWDHRPDPVSLRDLTEPTSTCDRCGDPRPILRIAPSGPIPSNSTDLDAASSSAVCAGCAWTEAGYLADVASSQSSLDDHARALHRTLLVALRPRRALIVTAPWPHTPLPVRLVPEARGRLAALLRSDLGLIPTLESRGLRLLLANALDRTVLFSADTTASRLTRYAARILPPTALRVRDLPVRDGLITWSTPVGHAAALPIDAASWTSTGDRLEITVHRTVGAGLTGDALSSLRERVGWLLPIDHIRLPATEPVIAGAPDAPLAAIGLLLASGLLRASLLRPVPGQHGSPRPAPPVRRVHRPRRPPAPGNGPSASAGGR